jgi:GDP-D-mannose 3',5'-epimerase
MKNNFNIYTRHDPTLSLREKTATSLLCGEAAVVCGAGGFIGGHLVKGLIANGVNVIRAVDIKPLEEWYQRPDGVESLTLDLKDRRSCLIAAAGASIVYQLAADMGGIGFIESNKARCMLSVLTNTHMILGARDMGVRRFFYASSACVYNAEKQTSCCAVPLKESDAYPAMPEDGYGWEKLFSERMCRHFEEDYGLICRIARYHNVYGPYGTWDGGREKAPSAICRKVIEAKLSGKHEISIWGDGTQARSFMYIDDCIKGTQLVAHSEIAQPINLGSSELVTIDQLVDLDEEIAGIKLKRIYNLSAPRGVQGRNSDNSMIVERLGWEPSIRLRDGLERTYRWIEAEMVVGAQPGEMGSLCCTRDVDERRTGSNW